MYLLTDLSVDEAQVLISDYMDKLQNSPVLVHDDEVIHRTLNAAGVILPRFRLCASPAVQQVLYDEYPQIGFTFNTFFNETSAFIIDGTRRPTNIGTWSTLLTAYMNDLHNTTKVRQNDSIYARMISATFGESGIVRDYGKQHQSTRPDPRLLSYADHEMLSQWMMRVNGISDMINSLALFLKIARPE